MCPWNIILRIETTDWPFGLLMFYFFFFSIGMCRVDDLLFEYMMIPRRVILIRPRAELAVETLQLSLFMLSLVANAGAGDLGRPNARPVAKALTPLLTN